MRFFLLAAIALTASSASAQNMWQMNAAYQNQFNTAQASAWAPYYYGGGYRYDYLPRYSSDFYRRGLLLEQQDQTRQLRQMNRTLRFMEWDLQDAARRR